MCSWMAFMQINKPHIVDLTQPVTSWFCSQQVLFQLRHFCVSCLKRTKKWKVLLTVKFDQLFVFYMYKISSLVIFIDELQQWIWSVMDKPSVRRWCQMFNEGRTNIHDEDQSRRPSLVTNGLTATNWLEATGLQSLNRTDALHLIAYMRNFLINFSMK